MASIQKKADGKWAVRYLDFKGVHRQRTFALQKKAKEFQRKVEDELSSGTHIARRESGSVADLASDFLRHQEDRMRDGKIGRSSYGNICSHVDNHIVPFVGGRRLNEIEELHCEEFYRELIRGGRKPSGFGIHKVSRGLAPRTARGVLQVLSQFIEWGITRRHASINPVPKAMKRCGGTESKEVATFTPEQIGKLLKTAATKAPFSQHRTHAMVNAIVNVAAFTGLRFGEIFALRRERIHLEDGFIEVRQSLTDYDELKKPKTRAGIRDVPLAPHLVPILRDWFDLWYQDNSRDLVFRAEGRRATPGQNSGHVLGGTFRKYYWWPLLRRAGLFNESDPFHFHALRHFAASWMVDCGLPLTEVASILGHRKFDTTLQVYAHPIVNGHRRQEVFEQMATRLMSQVETVEGIPVAPPMRQIPQAIDLIGL